MLSLDSLTIAGSVAALLISLGIAYLHRVQGRHEPTGSEAPGLRD
jgi:hypothetical protein